MPAESSTVLEIDQALCAVQGAAPIHGLKSRGRQPSSLRCFVATSRLQASCSVEFVEPTAVSRNSGKPPSTDPPGNLPNRGKQNAGERKKGDNPGHEGRTRRKFTAQEVDEFVDLAPETCGACGHSLEGVEALPYLIHQVLELLERPPSSRNIGFRAGFALAVTKQVMGIYQKGFLSETLAPA